MTYQRAMEILFQARIFDAAVVANPDGSGFLIYSGLQLIGRGVTIAAAMQAAQAAGEVQVLPPHPVYRAAGTDVQIRNETVARAISGTLAKRIATALNRYIPERGK